MKSYFNTQNQKLILLFIILFLILSSCKKLLDEKHLKSLVVPENLDDLQALLDANNQMHFSSLDMQELLADDYYTTSAYWNSANDENKLSYIWNGDRAFLSNWSKAYSGPIYYSNVVLDALPTLEIKEADKIQSSHIKGSALFHRALAFQQLAQLYCRPYSESAKTDLGIPLRRTAAIEVKATRSTVQETYDQIIGDLIIALDLLPENSLSPTRPTKAAALGLLARTYLSMRDYENAGKHADLFLKLHPELIDYNEITDIEIPFKRFNIETIFYNNSPAGLSLINSTRARIDSNLYLSYDPNDLRRLLFFKGNTGSNVNTYQFQGNYDSDLTRGRPFIGGITTNEIYLIRAESHARAGNKDLALNDLNTLMIKRWKNDGSWILFTASTEEQALKLILIERRKELVFRGLRWSDLRRYNLEGANITLKRVLDGVEYNLPPNDLRWVLLLPDEVINRSDMEQNPR